MAHELPTLVGQRVFGIALGYEDLIDHDDLRRDPVLGAVLGRLEAKRRGLAPLAGKSTLNRLEHAPAGVDRYRRIGHDGAAVADLFVDLFLDAHDRPPARITLDLDATDDPIHGGQEGRFFHGYYDCYCYLPLYIFCGDHLLAAKLRRANIDASAGAVEEIARIVGRIRAAWPRVKVLLHADGGFAREEIMAWAEANGVHYVFGLARNARLVERIYVDLAWVEKTAQRSGRPERRFADFRWTTRDSGSSPSPRLLPFERGIASHDTLNDVMNALPAGLFAACFTAWVEGLRETAPDIVAIDGKTSRRTRARGSDPLHLVTAWASRQRLVLRQEAVEDKSNEINAIPLLLEWLELTGALVTIDAIGCQSEIARAIRGKGADYLLA